MFLIATRNRPAAMTALIKACLDCGSIPPAAVMIDGTGEAYEHVPWPGEWHVHAHPDHRELAACLDDLLARYPGRPWYGLLADHSRPRSRGWWQSLALAAGPWGIACCEDNWMHGRKSDGSPHLTGATVIGGALVRALGWIALPGTVHFYSDDALELIGARLGVLRYLPEVTVESDHPANGRGECDANHLRLLKGRPYAADDRAAFERWRVDPATAARFTEISRAMSGAPS